MSLPGLPDRFADLHRQREDTETKLSALAETEPRADTPPSWTNSRYWAMC
jgi:hypothetical protein